MHVLLIHQAFASLNEPGGTRHYELARYLTSRGHHVTIIASPISYLTGKAGNAPQKQEIVDGITILRCYTYPALHRSFIHRVFSFLSFMISSFFTGLSVKEVDIVWGTSPPIFQGGTAWALARLKKCPFLFEVRDLWPAFAVGVGVLRHRLLIRLAEWFESFLYRHADRVMVNSPGFIEHVQLRGAKNPLLIPNGADTTMFNPQIDGTGFREQYNLEGKFIVLYAGAHGLSNDLDTVLDAALILKDNSHIAIVLLGDGKEKSTLMQRARQMQLSNLFFLPPIAKTEMPQAVAMADVCLAILKPIPLYKTVYPNKVFDYLASAKPVILLIDGVIRHVIEDAHAGVFISPGDSQGLAKTILELSSHPFILQRMGQNGRKYICAHFDRNALAQTLEQVLQSIV